MTAAIIEIEVEYAGKSRNSIHGANIKNGVPAESSLANGDLVTLGFDQLSEAAMVQRTDPSSPAFGPTSFLEAVIAWHRAMQHASCQIKGVYIREVPFQNGSASRGKSKRLNLTCVGTHIAVPEDDMENANVALQIGKTTAEIGSDNGMLLLRGALTKESTIADANDGVLLQDANVAGYATALLGATYNAGDGQALGSYFAANESLQAEGTAAYVVINTNESGTLLTRNGNPKRVFQAVRFVQGFEIIDATSRDARRRGRKRSTTPTGEV